MLAIGVLGAVMVIGYYCTKEQQTADPKGQTSGPDKDFGTLNTSYEGQKHMYMRDMVDTGVVWGIQRPTMLNVTNLNEAWKPYSAPSQKPSRSLYGFFETESEKSAYLGQYAHPFYFMRNGEIPLATPEQSNPNVEIPCRGQSIKGDPTNSLANYPRVYADISCNGPTPHIFSKSESRVWNAGQPTESEVVTVPREGQVNREFNPWGPGGVLQRIFNTRNERETRRKGVDRSIRTVPPPSQYYNTKYR